MRSIIMQDWFILQGTGSVGVLGAGAVQGVGGDAGGVVFLVLDCGVWQTLIIV